MSGTVSINAKPLDAYVAATSISTFFANPLIFAHVDRSAAKAKPCSMCENSGKSLINTGVKSTTRLPVGLIVAIGKLNRMLSVYDR